MTEVDIHEFDVEEQPDRERFEVTDDNQAAWAMRHLLSVRQRIAENQAIADAERSRIDEWLDRANKKFEPDAVYFEAILLRYAQQQRASDDRKSIETPYGVIKSRATQDKFKVVDEESFLEWATDNLPDAVNVKITPSISALKDHSVVEHTTTLGFVALTNGGEIIPGVSVEPGGVNYTVEVSE